jgi:hypothetical protein
MAKRKTKRRTMWVACDTGPELAAVYWQRNGVAVTQIEGEQKGYRLTHVPSGWAFLGRMTRPLSLGAVIKMAQAIAPLYPWNRLSFGTVIARREAMVKRIAKELRRAGLTEPK